MLLRAQLSSYFFVCYVRATSPPRKRWGGGTYYKWSQFLRCAAESDRSARFMKCLLFWLTEIAWGLSGVKVSSLAER